MGTIFIFLIMITEKQYKTALKVVSDYKKQQKSLKPKECQHYNIDWSIEDAGLDVDGNLRYYLV